MTTREATEGGQELEPNARFTSRRRIDLKELTTCLLLLFGIAVSASASCPDAGGALHQRWLSLWLKLELRGAIGDNQAAYRELAARYCEPHRAYHTLEHVLHTLTELDRVRDSATDPEAVELALWFHDVVYDIGAADNEEESARLAREAVLEFGLSEPWADRVSDLILATRHAATPTDADAQLVVDIDLSILGQPWERFDAYEQEIISEYAAIVEERGRERFNAGRAGILRRFLDRPAIYSTDYFKKNYEQQARANLERSIERLEDPAWTKPTQDGQNQPHS